LAVTDYDVSNWRDGLTKTLKPASVNRRLSALGALFRWAVENNRIENDPTRHVHKVDEQPVAPKALSQQDVTRILRKVQQLGTPRDIAILELL
jgi:integrase/recombinase XerC